MRRSETSAEPRIAAVVTLAVSGAGTCSLVNAFRTIFGGFRLVILAHVAASVYC